MTIISKTFSCLLCAGAVAFTGCLPEREEIKLPTQPAPATGGLGSGSSVSSETYYEMTETNRARMQSGTASSDDDRAVSNASSATTEGSDDSASTGSAADIPDPTPSPTPASGVPVEGRPGYIMSPNSDDPDAIIDVQGLPPGTEIKDPHSPGSTILVP